MTECGKEGIGYEEGSRNAGKRGKKTDQQKDA